MDHATPPLPQHKPKPPAPTGLPPFREIPARRSVNDHSLRNAIAGMVLVVTIILAGLYYFGSILNSSKTQASPREQAEAQSEASMLFVENNSKTDTAATQPTEDSASDNE